MYAEQIVFTIHVRFKCIIALILLLMETQTFRTALLWVALRDLKTNLTEKKEDIEQTKMKTAYVRWTKNTTTFYHNIYFNMCLWTAMVETSSPLWTI